ncbi:alanyl-tRNA synthetase [Salmonella enterica subsp. enterica]|uniref:Alanine--tRNA ligase n=1 Tax=Salmonella enterica I TaxID=59201 RepID=A0A3S4IQT1_SALET|nr:alanyl-tRNA synthetase [Salmonella enterica subsp. enterica]
MVAQQVGGKGGGRPDMAQAGGTDAAALPAALASVQGWVSAKIAIIISVRWRRSSCCGVYVNAIDNDKVRLKFCISAKLRFNRM